MFKIKALTFTLLVSVTLLNYSCYKKNNFDVEADFENFPKEIVIPADADILSKYTFYLKDKNFDKDIVIIKVSKGNVFNVNETNFTQESKSIQVSIENKRVEFYLKPIDLPDDYVSLSISIRNSNFAVPVKYSRLYPDTAYFEFNKTTFDTNTTDVDFKINLINRKLKKVSDNLSIYYNVDSVVSKYLNNPCVISILPYSSAVLKNEVLTADNIIKNLSQQKGTVYLSVTYPITENSYNKIKKTIIWK